ncbi:MAG: peptidyl-prolyl cis-trans isomerase [Pseudomonadota bacterium]|nr:peptidyl-prolyl cis-trans isomerase [Pseudomonadota bacterium]
MRIKTFMLLVCLCLTRGMAFADMSDEVAIIIGDHIVTRTELNQEKDFFKTTKGGGALTKQQEEEFVQWFVDTQLQLSVGRHMHVELDAKEVEMIENQLVQNNKLNSLSELREQISIKGVDFSMFMKNIKRNFLLTKINEMALYQRIKISDGQLDRLYEKEKEGKMLLYVEDIVFYTEGVKQSFSEKMLSQAEEVSRLWKNGTYSFKTIPKRSKMLSFKWETLAHLPNEFQSVVSNMNVGDVSAPIHTDNGYHVLKLIKRKAPEGFKINKDQLKQKMMAENMSKEVPKWIQELREQTYIRVDLD